jgi:hypothetical protein
VVEPDPNWEKWTQWLGKEPKAGTIYADVLGMRAARRVWEGFQAIIGVAPPEARQYSTFHSYFNGAYMRSQGLAIRRQVEVRDDVISLGRLLDRISKCPNVVTRERYLAELHPTSGDLGSEFFDRLVGLDATALDPATPLAHLRALREGTAKIRKWVDKEVAHYDRDTGKFVEGLTFGNIHRGIDLIFDTLNHYNRLLLGSTTSGSVTMDPWEAVFRVAWIPDDEAWRHVALTQQETDDRRL